MRSQYNIISAQTNPEIGEKIIVGLLMISDNYVNFSASKNKLSITKSLVSTSMYKFLVETITQLEKSIMHEVDARTGIYGNKLSSLILDEKYIEYLSRYSNGLINFSAPKIIDLEANDEVFAFLFKKYVDEKESNTTNKITRSIETCTSKGNDNKTTVM